MNVCILMSTYNGEKYLREQLESIYNQKDVDIELLVRDDGSTDKTIDILKEYESKSLLKWYSGCNLKSAKSFMDLLKNASDFDYYAFCDQDDYWEEDKLIRAISLLEENKSEKGKLYMSCLNVVDSNLNFLYKSYIPKTINIQQEMIKNYATGCTMVFDKKIKELVESYNCDYIAMHDSYVCRIALLNNSFIYLDQESRIKYRQHENNVLGMKNGFFSIWKNRFNRFIHSECIASKTANSILKCKNVYLKEEDKEFLNLLSNYKNNFKLKLKLLKLRIFEKEEKMTNFLFKIKLLFNKV